MSTYRLIPTTVSELTRHQARENVNLPGSSKAIGPVTPIAFQLEWLRHGRRDRDEALPVSANRPVGHLRSPHPMLHDMVEWAQRNLFLGEAVCGMFPMLAMDTHAGNWLMRRDKDGVLAHFDFDRADHVFHSGIWHTYKRPMNFRRPVTQMTVRELRDMYADEAAYRADSTANKTHIFGTPEEGGETGWYELDFTGLLLTRAPLSEWQRWRNFDGIIPAHRSVYATIAIGNINRLISKCSNRRREVENVKLTYVQSGWKYRYDPINFPLANDRKTLVSEVKRDRILPENVEDFAEAVALRHDMDALNAKLSGVPTLAEVKEAADEVVRFEVRLATFLGIEIDPKNPPALVFTTPDINRTTSPAFTAPITEA